jgi:ABC-2 type transport system permease protein
MVRQDLRLRISEPVVLVILVVLPIFLMAFFRPIAALALNHAGGHGSEGAEQTVPGMTLTFGFFIVGVVAFGIFAEHGWGTWDRLRMLTRSPAEIVVGKIIAPTIICLCQFGLLFLVGVLLFDLHVQAIGVLGIVSVAAAACIVSMGMAAAGMCQSAQQVNVIANIAIVGFGTLGGAMLPLRVLPSWARALAPATPAYWGMKGFGAAVDPATGHGDWVTPVLALVAFSLVFSLLAAWRFSVEVTKRGWQ